MPFINKPFRWVSFIAITSAIAFASWHYTRPKPLEVDLALIAKGNVETTIVNTRAGTIKSCQRSNLAPMTGGQIAKIRVKEGDHVQKGQILLELWNEDLLAQRELAQRQLAMAQERRRETCILAENARRESIRTQQLVEKGFVSSQRADDTNANARSRQASCEAAISDIKRAEAQIHVSQAGIDRTIISAPFSGVIGKISGELGEYTTPSPPGIPTPPTIDLIDDSCLYVTAPMDEVDAPKIRVGQEARITLDAMPEKVFPGKIRRIAPYVTEIEKQARTVDIEMDFLQIPTDTLLVGYSADVEVILERKENVLRIPTQAIRQNNKVWTVDEKNRLVEQSLETGLSNWSFTEIRSGLKAGDQVLMSFDQDDIKAGVAVQPKPQ
ncbi:efflux RND transporter periplasmic adaptor subunit [Nitrosomonas supralitoralis]|uniref:Efflux RND transporter periplasmic adaptor subunit n=1 Tax=Nitrosomonas supralitoralis TaxID=2116706 RepID=A0A2P7NVC6_9PROT|nr:efflux RND transporter periplasmic adaptor subunit [Nitrosomonas supralitoralis]PSJ17424.1 efflux RND transporter periplasmic adaptor subunit [Nitrosomonas supralitoralis]